ncbi:MAG: pseudouridine synthase [Cytophaga sp.]|uniref:pseudouridine synthase n=1 Tax=Cytophaga sp. TaxID=29535 RepID=UPI003F7F64B8
MNINEFLVKRFHFSKEKASEMVQENRVFINGIKALQRQDVLKSDCIEANGELLQAGLEHVYYAYYKPRGIECTLNAEIENNLLQALPFDVHVYPVGRLDKESEGLLLLTNDGKIYKDIAFSENLKEKEYLVEVDKALTEDAIEQLASGIVIMGQRTRPAQVYKVSDRSFRIILTQGLNRQIRRMCYKLNYEVTMLKRIRITSIELNGLQPGEFREISKAFFYTSK